MNRDKLVASECERRSLLARKYFGVPCTEYLRLARSGLVLAITPGAGRRWASRPVPCLGSPDRAESRSPVNRDQDHGDSGQ